MPHAKKELPQTDFNGIKKMIQRGQVSEAKDALTIAAQHELDNWEPQEKSVKKYQLVDFFCGAGGMSAGFTAAARIMAGIQVVGGCDINPDVAKTFEKNFQAPCITEDITNLTKPEKLKGFLAKLPDYKQDTPTIIIGCAPCQGFSAHRKKEWDKTDDRNNLVAKFATIAVRLNPECIVMENVPELLSKKYWPYYSRARKILEDAGYVVRQRVYNTAGFKVPQERFRTLVLAMKRDFAMPEPMINEDDYLTVKDAIGSLPRIDAGEICAEDGYHYSAKHKPATLRVIRQIPKDGGSRPEGVGPKCLDKVKGYYDVYGRLWWNRPAITITQYARNPASGRYIHPEQDRGLTIREAGLLQSFPRSYQFVGSFDAIFKQIGEAVPPRFACAVAANVMVELQKTKSLRLKPLDRLRDVTSPLSSSFAGVIAGMKSAAKRRQQI